MYVSAHSVNGNPHNEDRAVTAEVDLPGLGTACVWAVIDGHGGSRCAEYVAANLIESIRSAYADAAAAADAAADDRVMRAMRSAVLGLDVGYRTTPDTIAACGACLAVVCHYADRIAVAHAGDCRVVVGCEGEGADDPWIAEGITADHDCRNATECAAVRRRTADPDPIRCVGGTHRVGGMLAVTRAVGDGFLKDLDTPCALLRCVVSPVARSLLTVPTQKNPSGSIHPTGRPVSHADPTFPTSPPNRPASSDRRGACAASSSAATDSFGG
jgi:serine/threonine protein phosphatase PrpC